RLDRRLVVVEAAELRFGVRLGEDDRRGAVPAADVGDHGSRLELGLDAFERRDPRAHQVRVVAGAEEALGALEEVGLVLVPADAFTGAEALHDLRRAPYGGDHRLEAAEDAGGALLVRQTFGLLFAQEVATRLRVVGDVTGGGFRGEPFANVALVG